VLGQIYLARGISVAAFGAISPLGQVVGVIIPGVAFDAAADLAPFRWCVTALSFLATPPMYIVIRQISAVKSQETSLSSAGVSSGGQPDSS
jgi:hypothetical protein